MCTDTCQFAVRTESDPFEGQNYKAYPTSSGIPVLGGNGGAAPSLYARVATGSLFPADVDRIAFNGPWDIYHSDINKATAHTYAFRGHLEMDCAGANASYVLRDYRPQPYSNHTWPWGIAKPTNSVEALLALARTEKSKPEDVGHWGAALAVKEVRTAPATDVCPSTSFVIEPSFCGYSTRLWEGRCFWPVLDIQDEEPFTEGSTSWKFVIDAVEPRAVKAISIYDDF